jgi:nicotinate-nucleotide adenylyltransferase
VSVARVGVFGGSFNPIHFGHLLVASEVADALRLERVLIVPAASPPHKCTAELAPAHHRLAMVQVATAPCPRLFACDVEIRRAGPSYTAETLAELAGGGDELFLLLGSETFLDLPNWKDPTRLLELARLLVIPRLAAPLEPGAAETAVALRAIGADRLWSLETASTDARVLIVPATSLPVSASGVRRRLRSGMSVDFLLPAEVIAYIAKHRLYRDRAA